MKQWEATAIKAMIEDLRAGEGQITGRNYSEGMMWYSDSRLKKLSGAKFIKLSHARLLEIEGADGKPLTYRKTIEGFRLLHRGALIKEE
jgi:hypothetical protein